MPRLIYNMQTMLQVRDLRESVAFYTDLLGFKSRARSPKKRRRGPGCTPATRG
jgi:catechol 2,3-dioxygenase-like lactoylglutathione lyase family enzyme